VVNKLLGVQKSLLSQVLDEGFLSYFTPHLSAFIAFPVQAKHCFAPFSKSPTASPHAVEA
jgi:hypothetical protein